MKLTIIITKGEEFFVSTIKEIPALLTQEEARAKVMDALELYLEDMQQEPGFENTVLEEDLKIVAWFKSVKRIEFLQHLTNHQFYFNRHGGKYDIYQNTLTKKNTTVPRHPKLERILYEGICKHLTIPKM